MQSKVIEAIIPVSVCVVLPIAIVLIASITKMHRTNRCTEVVLKALETNKDIDTDKLMEAFRTPRRSARENLNRRLLWGCIFTLLAVFLATIGLVNFFAGSEFGSDSVTVPLVFAGASLAVGASFLIVCYVSHKQINSADDK